MTIKFQKAESGSLPMKRGRLIKTLADSTIRGCTDAIVELVTNSDDSYSKAEQSGRPLSGRIDIYVERKKGGRCQKIKVVDEASGMNFHSLKKAIEFGGETSGFKEGKTVRGFFGRGLKESIIALGKGTISTFKEGLLNRAEIFYDEKKQDAAYALAIPIANLSSEDLLEYGFESGKTGTIAEINILNKKKDRIPARRTIYDYVNNHFALRDINSSSKRAVFLHLHDIDSRDNYSSRDKLKYDASEGKLVFNEKIDFNGNSSYFKVYECPEQLESPKNPHGRAGLLVKTEGSILDNRLFGFETDPIGLHFFGEIICPWIAKTIREGDESIVDFNRGGLEWRHEYNRKLEKAAHKILSRLIEEKREKLKTDKKRQLSQPVEKLMQKLCRKLSALAKEELDGPEPGPGEIDTLLIRPIFGNIELGKVRPFSVYAPEYLIEEQGTKLVEAKSSNPNITLITPAVRLEKHKKYDNIFKSTIKVAGKLEGETSRITVQLGDLSATSEVRIAPMGKIGKKKRKLTRGGGLFTKIEPAYDDNPIQRFEYQEGGIIKIYMKFPGVSEYLGRNFEKLAAPEARLLLAEVLIEAFIRFVARRKAGKDFPDEIDPLISDMDRLRRKITLAVYNLILKENLKEILADQ